MCEVLNQEHGIDMGVLKSAWEKVSGQSNAMTSPAVVGRSSSLLMGNDEAVGDKPVMASVTSASSSQTSALIPTQEQIMKATVPELKGYCKALKCPTGGKKQDLIDRLVNYKSDPATESNTSGNNTTSGAAEVVKVAKKKKRSPNRMPEIPISSIQIKKNSFGNYEHPETKLIFNKDTKQVIGKQQGDGTISVLTEDDIQRCDQFKFSYKLPEKIMSVDEKESDKMLQGEDGIVETLGDIIASDDDDDFEEFFEDEDE